MYYKYKDMTHISSKPTLAPLHSMLLELITNVSSVPSSLGGGAHGYAGIILSPPVYTTVVPIILLITLIYPGIITVQVGAT